MDTRSVGRLGEKFALKYLISHGYAVVSTNWTCRAGEIDLVMLYQDVLVFIEVKYVRDTKLISPEDLFTQKKKHKLLRTINLFLSGHVSLIKNWRLDLVCVSGFADLKLTHYPDVLS